MINVLIGGH